MNTQVLAYALSQQGKTKKQIAEQLGITERQARRYIEKQRAIANADPAAIKAMQAVQSNALPHSFWAKTDGYSVYYKLPNDMQEDGFLDRVADAFANVPPAPDVSPYQNRRSDLMTVYPVMDMHIGMFAWGKETGGQDYDLENSRHDVFDAFSALDNMTPMGGPAVLILGGDTLHADDTRNQTPASGHHLDVDGRHYKVLDVAINTVCWMVDHLAKRHSQVTVRVLRGNHDEHSHIVLTFALAQRYRGNGTVTVDQSPRDLFMMQHGICMIAAHHGDKSPPQRLIGMIADVCPFWSATRDRHVLTGHIHHDSSKDFPGAKWHSLRAFCPPDAYGANFAPRRALQAMVFHDKKGLVMTAHEPIWRE